MLDLEDLPDLVEHLTMLPSDADDGLEVLGVLLKHLHPRAHLDGLWTGSEDKHYFFHGVLLLVFLCGWRVFLFKSGVFVKKMAALHAASTRISYIRANCT